jgi:hypothetical protein
VVPRVIKFMFKEISERKARNPGVEFMLRVSFVEIYGENIKDLIEPLSEDGSESKDVGLREGENGEIVLTGAKEVEVSKEEDLVHWLEQGALARTTGTTLMNEASSRSHAIFTLFLEQLIPVDEGEEGVSSASPSDGLVAGSHTDGDNGAANLTRREKECRQAKFHFVDLAGSERAKRTGAKGLRMKEGININKGLLALGNVISALGDTTKLGSFVPYRDSKLTRLLQDSLGGNSRTLMICCVSPADTNFAETLNALKYGKTCESEIWAIFLLQLH